MSVDWSEVETYSAIAAVCLNGKWRFFYDDDYMFILDLVKYEGEDYTQTLDEETFRPFIVNSQNAEKWMSKLAGELTLKDIEEGLAHGQNARLVFIINFDKKFWTGNLWNQDQSPLEDYQPDGWITMEGWLDEHLPQDLARVWDIEKIQGNIVVEIDGWEYILMADNYRVPSWGKLRTTVEVTTIPALQISIRQKNEKKDVQLGTITLTKSPDTKAETIDVLWDWQLGYNKKLDIRLAYIDTKEKSFWKNQFIQQLKSYQIE